MKLFYYLFFLSLLACKPNTKDPIPDISKHKVELDWVEMDKLIFASDTLLLNTTLINLFGMYPHFMKLYCEDILQLTDSFHINDQNLIASFQQMIADSSIQNLSTIIQKQFSDKNKIKNQFNIAASFMQYYFPEQKIDRVYSLLSEFGVGSFIFKEVHNDALGIGLDFFLGEHIDYKNLDPKNPAFSSYLNRTFNRDHLVKKSCEVWVDDFIPAIASNRFIDEIIREGKKLYVLSKILPEIHDSILFEYSKEQLDWCNGNMIEIWSFFLEKQLLYSTDQMKYNKYIKPSPSSPGMPSAAPGRTACFMGYQLVRAFATRKNITNPKLILEILDAKQILEESRFKPKNR